MDNSFFLRSKNENLEIERFHICTWEFKKKNSLVEFGIELDSKSIANLEEVTLDLYIPWIKQECEIKDFYSRLRESDNSRFIFNDSVSSTTSLDGGQNSLGVIHKFNERERLCILPVQLDNQSANQKIQITIDLSEYKKKTELDINVYVRFGIESNLKTISTQKKGIGKSTLIYDVKINEKRNIPKVLLQEFKSSSLCKINTCFCFHIVPNSYDITFLESEHLKNVRTLEFKPFKNYLNDSRLKDDELMVVFSKKKELESYTFFSIYTKELIGISQFAVAILINIFCGFLFVLPTIREQIPGEASFTSIISDIPIEFYVALFLALSMFLYFFLAPLLMILRKLWIQVFSFKNRVEE